MGGHLADDLTRPEFLNLQFTVLGNDGFFLRQNVLPLLQILKKNGSRFQFTDEMCGVEILLDIR